MGIIRGGLLTLVSFLLFMSFFVGNTFLTLSWSLEYDVIKPELVSVFKEVAEKEMDLSLVMEDEYVTMLPYCENNTEYVFSSEGRTFVTPCSVIEGGSEAVLDYQIEKFVEEAYYKDYGCEGLDCIKNIDWFSEGLNLDAPLVLFSKKAMDFSKRWFYISLLISAVLIVLAFLLIEHKTTFPLLVGALLALASLPFVKIYWFLSLLFGDTILGYFTVFFTKSYNVFLITFILGLIIIAIGVALKFWTLGSFLSKKFKKTNKVTKSDVKKIVKEEVKSSKEKKSK